MAAKKYENKAEFLYCNSVETLLMYDNIKYIIRMRKLFRYLSNSADRIDEASDRVCQILMKEIS